MKQILVEFGEYGATIYKDPEVIEAKKDLPNCFINPDLSKVSGVSPTYWALNEYNKIIKCTEEEMLKRNTYHHTIVGSENPSVEKVNIEDLRKEFDEKFNENEDALMAEINLLKQNIAQSENETQQKIDEMIADLAKHKAMLMVSKIELAREIHGHKKYHKIMAIIAVGLAAGAIVAKFYLGLN